MTLCKYRSKSIHFLGDLMGKRLVIIGAGIYALVAYDIAAESGNFDRIVFVDDGRDSTPLGTPVFGRISDICDCAAEFDCFVVAIGSPEVRASLIDRIESETELEPVSLISERAFVSPSAEIGPGCVIEPMSVVHAGCVLGRGCIVSAGAAVNHMAVLLDAVHVDCNATVAGNVTVPPHTKVYSGTVFSK